MIIECNECQKNHEIVKNQSLEICDVCGNIMFFKNQKFEFKRDEEERTKNVFLTIDMNETSRAHFLIDLLLENNPNNIFAYIGYAIIRILENESYIYNKLTGDDLVYETFKFLKNINTPIDIHNIRKKFNIGMFRMNSIMSILNDNELVDFIDHKYSAKKDITVKMLDELIEIEKKNQQNKRPRGIKLFLESYSLVREEIIRERIEYLDKKFEMKLFEY